jgi:hypothetical protein
MSKPDNLADPASVLAWWRIAPQLPEAELYEGVLALANQVHYAAMYDDYADMHQKLESYLAGEQYFSAEPHFSIYEFGKLAVIQHWATEHLSKLHYSEAVDALNDWLTIYRSRLERYARSGQRPRRATQTRIGFLISLAELKWMAGPGYRDSVLTPGGLFSQARECALHIEEFYASNPIDRNRTNVLEAQAILECMCHKVALLYAPELLPDMLASFNARYQDSLTLEPLHYRSIDPRQGDRSAHYWELEVAKLRFEPQATLQDLYACLELRALAARYTYMDRPLAGVFSNWRREALFLIRERKESLARQAQQMGQT